jgi:flagellar L-ring protein precursor FlgH
MNLRHVMLSMLIVATASAAWAQSSSLYVGDDTASRRISRTRDGRINQMSPFIAESSFVAVAMPEPREFALHDLVTIIIREATETDISGGLETEKSSSIKGKITAFPQLNIADLLEFQLGNNNITDPPELNVTFDQDFEGQGDYERRDSFTARITARIVDIKPNGTMVLEARKYIKSDTETLEMVITGTCRAEDVTADNTVLSTQMYDLRLVKNHDGEVRRSSKKGILTRVLETVFNF